MTDYKVHLQMQDAEDAVPLITVGMDTSVNPVRIEVHSQGIDPGPDGARVIAGVLDATAEAIKVELGILGSDHRGRVEPSPAPRIGESVSRPPMRFNPQPVVSKEKR